MIFVLNFILVVLVVGLHYEVLHRIALWVPLLRVVPHFRILFGVLGTVVAHVAEVCVFAFAYFKLGKVEGWGGLEGSLQGGFLDNVYFSFTTYTTLGFGDITPIGELRYVAAMEVLVGLILIAWTASFLYFQIQTQWMLDEKNTPK